jgi:hypothetical protein
MWCPACKAEYVAGVGTCTECRISLVTALPPDLEEPEDTSDRWRLAGEFLDEIQAQLVEGMLNDNGIPCRLENVTFHSYPVPISKDMARVRLWVGEEQLEEARSVLAEAERSHFCSACEAVVSKEDTVCPGCGEPLEDDETE